MSPFEYAAKLRVDVGKDFVDELFAHHQTGFVLSTPEGFLMGKPCPKGVFMHNVWERWDLKHCTAWFVWLAVGDAWRLFDNLPYELPWIGWFRQGRGWIEPQWVPTALLRRKLRRTSQQLQSDLKSVIS